jgi:hypothetical protein
LVKPASVATSNAYLRGRTPDVLAFSMVSVTGWRSTATRAPVDGSRTFGAEIATPGMGPATVALSGFELLVLSHADMTTAASRATADRVLRVIDSPELTGNALGASVRSNEASPQTAERRRAAGANLRY